MLKTRAILGFWQLAIVALFLAPIALAQNDVPITLTSAGNYTDDGIYVSPYYATVNGAQNTPIVCDDFKDESYVASSWNANITSFSSLSATNLPTAWGNALGVSASTFKLYEEAAWLTIQTLGQTPGSQGQINYSYAVWATFDPSGVANYLDNGGNPGAANIALCNAIFGAGNNCASTKVTGGLLSQAQGNAYYAGEFGNVFIISPLVAGTNQVCDAESGNCPAQEFMEVVPEGGATLAYLFIAGFCCFGAIFRRGRQQAVPQAI
jgi:hypothetical protein